MQQILKVVYKLLIRSGVRIIILSETWEEKTNAVQDCKGSANV